MLSGGKDSFDACKGVGGRDAEYCRWLVEQCGEQKKTQGGDRAGAQSDRYVLITCSGEELTFPSYDVCVGTAQLFAHRSNRCPKVWGLIPINFENAVEKVGKGKAIVIVANPDDLQLGENVSGLRKDYRDHKFFLVDSTDLGAYATLAMLKVNKEMAKTTIKDGFIEPLIFDDGSCQGVAQPALVATKPLSEADKDERPARPTVPDEAKNVKEVAKAEEKSKADEAKKKGESKKAEERKVVIERKKIVIMRKRDEAKKPIEGPTGFMELRWKTLGDVKDVINKGKYPVMLVVGSEHPASRELKESLFKLQQSGQWEYHRLIFVNLHIEKARQLLKQVGLSYRRVKKLRLLPQIYVFKGKLQPRVPRGGFSTDHMQSLRRRYIKMARKVKEAKEVAKGPLGHLKLIPENFNEVKSEILTSSYPFMVVVGSAESPTDKFWKNLFALQQGDKWEYHRLIFINFYTESAKDLMQKLGIYDHVKKVGFFPQMYVFRGKLSPEEPEGGFTKDHMRSLKRRLVKMAKE